MSAACSQKRDADLLMLAHGEVGGLGRVATLLHVRRCKCCRERLNHFASLSGVMKAGVLGISPAKVAYAFDIEDVPWKALTGRRLVVGVALISILWWWFLATQARADTPPAPQHPLATAPDGTCKVLPPPPPPPPPASTTSAAAAKACAPKN